MTETGTSASVRDPKSRRSPGAGSADVLTELLERVKAASGPSYSLDAEIATEIDDCYWDDHAFGWFVPGRKGVTDRPPAVTESIDSALALAERVLPKCDWTISNESPIDGPGPFAWVQPEVGFGVREHGKSPALALLAALLSAMIAQEEEQ